MIGVCYNNHTKYKILCVVKNVEILDANEREESVVNQHNLFRKKLYSNNETTCFGL